MSGTSEIFDIFPSREDILRLAAPQKSPLRSSMFALATSSSSRKKGAHIRTASSTPESGSWALQRKQHWHEPQTESLAGSRNFCQSRLSSEGIPYPLRFCPFLTLRTFYRR